MTMITVETIDEVADEISELTPSGMQEVIRIFQEEQPALLIYLTARSERDLSEQEQDLLFFMSTVIWEAVRRSYPGIKTVSYEQVEETETSNIQWMQQYEESFLPEEFIKNHSEVHLLAFIVSGLLEEEGEEHSAIISEDGKGLIFLIMKTFLDCLIKAAHSRRIHLH